jgi:hypothetical protein
MPKNKMGTAGFPQIDTSYGIRTRDLRLERAASWATRRTRRIAYDSCTSAKIVAYNLVACQAILARPLKSEKCLSLPAL